MSHLRSILPYFRPYRRGMALGLALVVVSNVFTIAGPYLMKLAIDALYDPEVTRGDILTFAGLIVGAALVGGAARYGMREILNGISRRIECDLRVDFFRHLMSLDADFFSRNRTGDIMSRATNDTLAVRQAAGPAVMYAVNTTVVFAFALTLMLWISPRLTALALIPMILLPPIVLFFGRVIHRRFEKIQSQFSDLSTMVQENLTGVRLVRAYGQEAAQAEGFREINRQYMERNMHLVKASGLFHPLLSLLTGTAMVIVLWVGGGEVMAGRISVGDFVAFTFYLTLLIWPMIALGWVVNLFQRGAASMARINEFMRTVPSIPPAGAGPETRHVRGEIEFRNVSFRYPGTERLVLRNVSFRIKPGQTIAIVGPTGSGKSTLVSLIPRIHDPMQGEIFLDGKPLKAYDPGEVRRITGMVPQDTFLFSTTIRENIALGMEKEPAEGDVRHAAEIAQLHEAVEGFPRRYETQLGERGINLSGGQKQRTALARALARDPVILILDDALSAVDTHTEARILKQLRGSTREQTSFIISHRVSAVMHADRILVLDDGAIVEEGRHEELIAANNVYASLLRRQMLEQDLAQTG